jgi:ATP-dependent DNA ligase
MPVRGTSSSSSTTPCSEPTVRAGPIEGVVAKWAAAPYGTEPPSWIKIKNPTYSQAIGRRERFEKMNARRARAARA